jgi:hypothetical protein
MRKNPRRILSPQRLPFRHPGRAEIKHSTTCSRATLTLTTGEKVRTLPLHSGLRRVSETVQLSSFYSSNGAAYSQCDQALPCSSCFFLASASMRRRSEHSSQMVSSEDLPHILQTCRACSGRASAASLGIAFMVASLAAYAGVWAGPQSAPTNPILVGARALINTDHRRRAERALPDNRDIKRFGGPDSRPNRQR